MVHEIQVYTFCSARNVYSCIAPANDQNKNINHKHTHTHTQKETSRAARAPCLTTGPGVSSPPGPPLSAALLASSEGHAPIPISICPPPPPPPPPPTQNPVSAPVTLQSRGRYNAITLLSERILSYQIRKKKEKVLRFLVWERVSVISVV